MFNLLLLYFMFEPASYSKINSCTSNNINSIKIDLEVIGESENQYQLQYDYSVRTIVGSKSATKSKWIDKYLFSDEFLINLRRDGSYTGQDFSFRYDRQENDCDHIIMSDFPDYPNDVNLKVCSGLPLLGVLEASTKGRHQGISFKACVGMI